MHIFNGDINFKNREIPKILLGTAPFTAESYFGHRTRLYELDLYKNPKNIAKVIKKSFELGVKGINLNTNEVLIEGFEIAISQGVKMDVIGIIGKTNMNYMFPDMEKAQNTDWREDIKTLSKYNPSIIFIDEFIVDSYDWNLLEEILLTVKNKGYISGLITSFPFKTTEKLLKSPILDLFEFYMVPVNKLGYMMDTDSFLDENRVKLSNSLNELNKKIAINKILATGIQMPKEAFNFLKKLDYADMVTIGVSSEKEAEEDFELLLNM
ncbi:MAG: hypothetical protein LBB45_00520 [Methanobrevibacter sp.]|jgi:hypothetical protein|nr:hypothetical protein [Candidatus Methanovirga basalitermitum]